MTCIRDYRVNPCKLGKTYLDPWVWRLNQIKGAPVGLCVNAVANLHGLINLLTNQSIPFMVLIWLISLVQFLVKQAGGMSIIQDVILGGYP